MTYPDFVAVGAKTYHGDITFHRWGNEQISIGKWCALSQGIKLLAGGGHRTDTVTSHPIGWALGLNGPAIEDRSYDNPDGPGIKIGNACWIGYGVTIIGNVTVGDGAVIAANSTVFSDVPPYAVCVGNPGRTNKFLFDEATVAALLRIAWWDWPESRIKWRMDDFYMPVAEFVARFDVDCPIGRMPVLTEEPIKATECIHGGKFYDGGRFDSRKVQV